MRRTAGLFVVVALVAGCASMSVTTEHSRGVDFSKFETFQYQDSDMSVADTSSTAHKRIVDAIKRQLTANGLTETDSQPDLFVTYYGESTGDTVVDSSDLGYAANTQFYRAGNLSQSTSIMRFERGTIVVDLWDAPTHELIWRGQVEKSLSRNPDANLAKIDEGIAKMFRSFPPAP